MKKLTYLKRINGYKKGKGTLVLFVEKHEKGELAGKPIVFWSDDSNFKPESKLGWTIDEENRVSPPETTKEDEREHAFILAQKYGITLSV